MRSSDDGNQLTSWGRNNWYSQKLLVDANSVEDSCSFRLPSTTSTEVPAFDPMKLRLQATARTHRRGRPAAGRST